MTSRRACSTAVITVLVALVAACAPAASPGPGSGDPTSTTSSTTTSSTSTTTSTTSTTTTTTAVPLPASIDVVLSQPSPGAGTTLISGQVAPVEYLLTVENSGDAPSGRVVVTDRVPSLTTLVENSASCGTTPNCTVEVIGSDIAWTIDDVAPRATHALTFTTLLDKNFGRGTSVSNTAAFTNVATPACATTACATATVTNPAEEFKLTKGWVSPRNSVYFSGINNFTTFGWSTNDPAAEISYKWDCSPSNLCELLTPENSLKSTFNFHWDDLENQNFILIVRGTATQGDRTLVEDFHLWFRVDVDISWVPGDHNNPNRT